MTEVKDILKARGEKYGTIKDNAHVAQEIMYALDRTNCLQKLSDVQMYAITMIATKLSRIVNGDPDYLDSWNDIAGYSTLVVDYISGKE